MNTRKPMAAVGATALLCASAGSAAAAGVQLAISPAHIRPGGTVMISVTPRMSCSLTLTIAKKAFTHPMRYGALQIRMPRTDIPGRVPVKVNCGGSVATGSFTVSR